MDTRKTESDGCGEGCGCTPVATVALPMPTRRRQAAEPAHEHSHDHGHEHGHDHGHAHTHGDGHAHEHDCCGGACAAPTDTTPDPGGPGLKLRIPAMDCAVEEGQIRRALEGIDGIRTLRFALAERTLRLDAEPAARDAALAAIRRAGFAAEPLADDAAPLPWWRAAGLPRLGAALALAAAAELLHALLPASQTAEWAGMALAAAAIALAGLGVLTKGFAALARRRLDINALMSVAVVGAFAIGQWPEAAMVMALYTIAELIEARAVDRARGAIAALMAMAPEVATLRRAGAWVTVPVAQAAVGETLRVRPGERFPVDAVLSEGTTSVDQAAVTGESLPVDKQPGDALFAGTLNLSGAVEARITAPASRSTLARIVEAVEHAQASRAPTQRFVDRFAAVYTPAVFAIALAVALGGPLVAGWAWTAAIYKALVLLVIACPCALVISTPVALSSGLAAAARRGVLLKGGAHLEAARRIRAVAFDKTGTLTEGRPRLVHWQALAGDEAAARALGAALAAQTDHPVSRAIAAGLAPAAAAAVSAVQALHGRGVVAQAEGAAVWLGSRRLAAERGALTPELEAALAEHERQGRGLTLLGRGAQALALFAVADTLKPGARETVSALKALGVVPVMLSGDHGAAAQAVAAEAGIDEVRADLLPEDKLAAIEELQRRHGPTAMAGDGLNDAPALARSDLGIAMGAAGTDVAIEAADVVVMNDDPRRVAETVRLSRATHAVLVQNIVLALGIKAVFLALAVFDDATMWMAVFADMGASLIVVFNGLRLLRRAKG
ncbi:heavy metal translocating P-type ATPase [Rubrivivax gelatinosus]|uniref:P-type Zn(2+) transporter n=1 Tax=Rubrivivax gelatinosus (strain NBRC 100245 / IL144) TaxID=983917 RepID=I0HLS7_RUBGI|nr:heavy metal translocating P-type ATPase [Rubrivivax gelatinosus]BAL93964.1 heavy metal translocating P-type ATPase [Rubrivivax gelatinosus IL144]